MDTQATSKKTGIKNWPEDEQPRERLLKHGPEALTDAELLSILLRSGVEGKNAIELGCELLLRFGSLQAMMAAPISGWNGIKGLGEAKVAQLVAALELGRRAAAPGRREDTVIKSTTQAADYLATRLRGLAEEHFCVIYFNRRGRLLDDALILIHHEGRDPDAVQEQVLVVYNNAPDVRRLPYVDGPTNKVEWIVSVSMLNEGWDVKRVFQIVPHEERAFNSKLLIAQVLGHGLRVPEGWDGPQSEVTVFNHDRWAPHIRHLVNEVLEIEKRISCRVLEESPYHFDLHNIDYDLDAQSVRKYMTGEYTIFVRGYIDLATESSAEDVAIDFEDAITGQLRTWHSTIRRKTYTPREIALIIFDRLEQEDEDAAARGELDQRGRYTDTWTVHKLEEVVRRSLENIHAAAATESMRQKFLQALGTLRRRESENVRYVLNPRSYKTLSTHERHADSVSAAELRATKTLYFTDHTHGALEDEQIEFFDEVTKEGSGFKAVSVRNRHDFKTPLSAAIADSENERRFIWGLLEPGNLAHYDTWIKSTATRFYEIDYAWKKRNRPKRGKFSPDFFIKIGDLIQVIEIKGDEELSEPSEENIKKNEYSMAHFAKLNEHLEAEGSPVRFRFNFLTPTSFNPFFQALRDGGLVGFTSELDVKLKVHQ